MHLQTVSLRAGSVDLRPLDAAACRFKVNLAKYLEAATNGVNYSGPNPLSRITTVTTRSFNDANKNFAPDCNLLNPAANGECGAMSSQTFGQNVFSNTYDPAILHGWGVRGRRERGIWTLQRQPQQVRAGQQLHHVFGSVRQPATASRSTSTSAR
jgi:hypothetical protein